MAHHFAASLLALVLILSLPTARNACGATTDRPNIIFILLDDFGWADLACYGSTFHRTPHVDRLAKQGMRFTDAYAAGPVCSPTRAAIMTGQSPARLHLTDWLPGRPDMSGQKLSRPAISPELPLAATTIPEGLKKAGYLTAHIGKWHLGGKNHSPLNQGFDVNIAGDHTGTPLSYFAPFHRQGRAMPGLEQAEPGEYLTDRLNAEAVRFIQNNKDRPFFLYLSHYAVHIPLAAKTNLIHKYAQALHPGQTHTNPVYAAMIESVDAGVGRIVQQLEESKIADRTMILFTSDNGGLSVKEGPLTPATSNAPLRAGKGYLYEGGTRVPLIVSWPGMIPAGSACSVPVSSIDFFPTFMEIAKVKHDPVEGVTLWPLLSRNSELAARDLFWHYPHYSNQGGKPGSAIRSGNFKLIEFFEDQRLELFDLSRDPGEQNNIRDKHPEKASELAGKLAAWREHVGAQMMTPNSNYRRPVSN